MATKIEQLDVKIRCFC